MVLKCGVGEDSWESPGLQGDPVHPKGDQFWVFIGRTDVEAETPIPWPPDAKNWLIWKDHECWERLRAGGEGDNRGWDGWMASPIQWTWVWVNSRSWWWTGRPGSQRIGHDWVTELDYICRRLFGGIFSYILIWIQFYLILSSSNSSDYILLTLF